MPAFADLVTKSVEKHRVLVEIDIADPNTQWVNAGAGIWYVNALNLYPEVGTDDDLGSAFTAQNFGAIGSVRVDAVPMTKVATLLEVTTTDDSFYYDASARELFVRLANYDEPILHQWSIGTVYGYCNEGFVPIGAQSVYEGRLTQNPKISASRDPLFFGRITFRSGSADLINTDGELDRFGIDEDLYGNEARILLGFDSLDYSDYETIFTGYVTRVTIGEEKASFQLTDSRKQLTKPITFATTDTNALTAIENILDEAYGYDYSTTFYDTTAWEIARSQVENVTLDMQEPAPVIEVIEDIAASVFGLFRVNADNKFTFRIVDAGETIETLIEASDVLSYHTISYDPTEVVSSVRVGYDKDWTTTGTAYTYYTDDTREASVFSAYKTYNQREFDTLLVDATAAAAFATRVLDYTDTVRGRETIEVPLEHYARDLGDMVGVVTQRGDQPMIGERKAEVIGVEVGFDSPVVKLTLRDIGIVEDTRKTEGGAIRITEGGAIRMVG